LEVLGLRWTILVNKGVDVDGDGFRESLGSRSSTFSSSDSGPLVTPESHLSSPKVISFTRLDSQESARKEKDEDSLNQPRKLFLPASAADNFVFFSSILRNSNSDRILLYSSQT